DIDAIDVDAEAAAGGVVRAGVAHLQRVDARGQHRAGVNQHVARVLRPVFVDVGFRTAVDGNRGDAPVVAPGDVQLDLGAGETDGDEVVGRVGVTHRPVERAHDVRVGDVRPTARVVELVLARTDHRVVHRRDGLAGDGKRVGSRAR